MTLEKNFTLSRYHSYPSHVSSPSYVSAYSYTYPLYEEQNIPKATKKLSDREPSGFSIWAKQHIPRSKHVCT